MTSDRTALCIHNPSDFPRGGPVHIPWAPIAAASGLDPTNVMVVDAYERPLRAQVDDVDPHDSGRATLVVDLDRPVPAGADDYSAECGRLFVTPGLPEPADGPREQVIAGGFRLQNDRLNVWMSLGAQDRMHWLAGSASSVILDGREFLDAFNSDFLVHDPEKRCMQIDRVRVARPPWDCQPYQEEWCGTQPWAIVTHGSGPVRAYVTIASAPFFYEFHDHHGGGPHRYRCRMYRVMSLYRGNTFIIDELYIRGTAVGTTVARPIHLAFSPRYFAYFEMGQDRRITHFRHIPDWFSIGCRWNPFQVYTFATDVHSGRVENPHPDIPLNSEMCRNRSYSWRLGTGLGARCLHHFGFAPPEVHSDIAGRSWYEHIYKPLRASLAP